MPSTDQLFRISWASFSMGDMSSESDIASDNSIFVGDLASDVNDAAFWRLSPAGTPLSKIQKLLLMLTLVDQRAMDLCFITHLDLFPFLICLGGRFIQKFTLCSIYVQNCFCSAFIPCCFYALPFWKMGLYG